MYKCLAVLLCQLTIAISFNGTVIAHALSTEAMRPRPRTFIVTGATDGIGKHTAQRLASDGYAVLVHGRKPVTDKVVTSLISDLESRGAAKIAYLQADLNDLHQV